MGNIVTKDLKKFFMQGDRKLLVLNGITVAFEQEKSYAITGVSGTGKSTFLHLLAGLDKPSSGQVLFDDKDIEEFSLGQKERYLNMTIGLMFQLPYLISELSVVENVMVPGMIAGKTFTQGKKKALSLLNELGISQKAYEYPDSLSGGQQQRVALARALLNKPKFLLADEPTGNLDIKTGKALVDLMLSCKEKWGMGLIISSHDPYVAQIMDYTFCLEDGYLRKI